ncbi:TRAP transporter small permease [Pontibacterium granulatum]|uniref:TRAP transporter small permease n=1 Tax=Pontibacterium granulatum TaxID=2036029 RepID=UPI00249C8D29|nr:TRAP transporter small permease [Pontibacterium granulatum]MDI3324904.1 TRAP transporter small permease [Pontibacterium granulatum]
MQTLKHYFYLASAVLSGTCLVVMTLLILAQIAARMFGVIIPSSEDFAGWLLSATIFFGLAYTFNTGNHIRVTILLCRLEGRARRLVEFFNLTAGVLISGYLAYYTAFTAYESYIYNDVTDTYLAVPLWIVQSPMALGSLFLLIAIIDSYIAALQGEKPGFIAHEDALSTAE